MSTAYPESLYAASTVVAPSTGPVTDARREEYRRDGFVAVDAVLSADEVEVALAGLAALVTDPPDGVDLQQESGAADRAEPLDSVRRLMRFVDHEPRLAAVAAHPMITAAAATLLGTDELIMIQDMALLKPPGGGREKPWHQDKAYFAYDLDAPVVGVWLALDRATRANGCMHVIPGSHRAGPADHFGRRDWQLCDTAVATDRVAAVPLEPGGALFFDGLLHHGTPANRTRTRRRALQFHYAPAGTALVDDEQRLAVFGAEGRGATC